jgi:hypothetical protein
MGKVIIVTKFAWEIYLPLFLFIPSSVNIKFNVLIIVSTSLLIFTLFLPSGFLVTLWVCRFQNMYILQLDSGNDQSHSLTSCSWMNYHLFYLVCNQICGSAIDETDDAIDMWYKIYFQWVSTQSPCL